MSSSNSDWKKKKISSTPIAFVDAVAVQKASPSLAWQEVGPVAAVGAIWAVLGLGWMGLLAWVSVADELSGFGTFLGMGIAWCYLLAFPPWSIGTGFSFLRRTWQDRPETGPGMLAHALLHTVMIFGGLACASSVLSTLDGQATTKQQTEIGQ